MLNCSTLCVIINYMLNLFKWYFRQILENILEKFSHINADSTCQHRNTVKGSRLHMENDNLSISKYQLYEYVFTCCWK